MTLVIAEIGSNWLTKEDCYKSIEKAKECGAGAVKFQHYDDIDLYGFDADKDTHKNAIPVEWVPDLSEYARGRGLKFGCTFFEPNKLARNLEHLDFVKIASSDMQHYDMIEMAIASKKPVYISVGGHTTEEIRQAIVNHDCNQVTWLFCDSAYPAPTIPYACIAQLVDIVGGKVGISDHTKGSVMITAAHQFWNFPVIEKHVNLIGCVSRPDSGSFAVEAQDFAKICHMAKTRKDNSILDHTGERSMRELHNRRMVATKAITKGDELDDSNTAFARALYPCKNYITALDHMSARKDYKPGESI